MDVLQTNIISIQSNLYSGLQQLLQVTDRLIDVNVLSDEITCCDGLFLDPTESKISFNILHTQGHIFTGEGRSEGDKKNSTNSPFF